MKRLLCISLALAMLLYACCGCRNNLTPVPDYPLDTQTVESALEEAGLAWTVTEGDAYIEHQKTYTLNDADGKLIAGISSVGEDNSRFLQIIFMSPYGDAHDVMRSLPESDWEKAIVFATMLYGGFDTDRQVYEDFLDNFEKKSAVRERGSSKGTPVYEEIVDWTSEMNGIQCVICIGQPKLADPGTNLEWIKFYNSDAYEMDANKFTKS